MKSITVLKLKLDTTDEQKQLLASVAETCRDARCAGAENWLMRQRGFPETPKQAKPGKKGSLSESTKIYHAVRAETPTLNCQLHATLAAQVNSFIGGKVDWRDRVADSTIKRRKDAILARRMRPPFFTALEIPVPCSIAVYTFTEKPELRLPWGSPGTPPLSVACCMGKMPAGYKRLLRSVAEGGRKLSDSRIVERDGEWFWHLPVAFETTVSSEVEATFRPTIPDGEAKGQSNRPFVLDLPGRRPWYVGDGEYLLAQVYRLTRLMKEVGWRYRQGMGAGHGRKKVDAAVSRRHQQKANIVAEVRRRIIRDVVRRCEQAGVGKLVYREPSLPVREKSWFSANGLEWDWTRLRGDLENSLARAGIELVVQQLKMKEVRGNEGEKARQLS